MKTSNSRVLLSFEPFFIIKNPISPSPSGRGWWRSSSLALQGRVRLLTKIEKLFCASGAAAHPLSYRVIFLQLPKFCNSVVTFLTPEADDGVRRLRQRHDAAYLFLNPSHFQVGIGRSYSWHCIQSRAVNNEGLECRDLLSQGYLDLVLVIPVRPLMLFRGLSWCVDVGVIVIDFLPSGERTADGSWWICDRHLSSYWLNWDRRRYNLSIAFMENLL